MTLNDSWREDAVCQQTDPELFDPHNGYAKKAKTVCNGRPGDGDPCPVRDACLLDALTEESTHAFGPWLIRGGMSPKERRELAPKDRQALINQLTTTIRTTTRPGDPR